MRVGLVGWACRTGIGQLNHDLARLAPWITTWLVPEHAKHGTDARLLLAGKSLPCAPEGDDARYAAFLDAIDVLLFAERQYVREDFDLVRAARERGRLVCAIPMLEFLRDDERWLAEADLLWAPTRWSARELHALARRRAEHARGTGEARWRSPWTVVGGRFGVDTELFAFQPRRRCTRFLFVNGHGGYRRRKGADLVARAAELAPEVPILVRSQAELPELPEHVDCIRADAPERAGLYASGDVLLAPSRWEGIGQTLYEAQACGLPVVTTDADPMRECGGALVPVARSEPLAPGRPARSHEVQPEALARKMRELHGRDIRGESLRARDRVVQRFELRDVVRELGTTIEARLRQRDGPT